METFDIKLKNFQSIGKAELLFEPGVNLIVGQSNSGKTAILRAISAALNNPTRGKYFIKKGTASSEVAVTFEGNEIKWRRTPSDSSYEINGEVYKKTGRTNLFELLSNNGFVRDDSGNVMNIEGEWDLPFPFDRTPAELFKLFENIFCISDSAVILKSFKDEESAVVKDKIVKEDKLTRINKKIDALEELNTEVNIEKINRKLDIFDKNCEKYKKLNEDLAKICNSEKYSTINLDEVTPPVEESLTDYIDTMKDYTFLCKVVKRQKFYKSLPDSVIIGDTLEKYAQVVTDYEHVTHAVKLKDIDLSRECDVSGETLSEYLSVRDDYKDLINLEKISSFDLSVECTAEDSLTEYEAMLRDYKFIVECYDKCKALKQKYAKVDSRIEKLQSKLAEYKVCPLCGHELGDDKC